MMPGRVRALSNDGGIAKAPLFGLARKLTASPAIWLVPGLAVMIALFIRPIVLIFQDSFTDPTFGIDNYINIASDPLFRKVIFNSFRSAFHTTVLCILIGYPAAYAIFRATPRWRSAMLGILLFSFAVGTIPRAFSWLVILGDKGLINGVIHWFSGRTTPVHLLYNEFGVVVGMVHAMLPYMVLILLGSMMRVSSTLVPAARTLGSTPMRAFLEIFLPLTMPGILAGGMLVFVYSLGFYLVPAVLGGASQTTVVMQIESLALKSGIWGMGAALSSVIIVISVIGAGAYVKVTGLSDVAQRH